MDWHLILIAILVLIIVTILAYWRHAIAARIRFAKSPPIVLDIRTVDEYNSGHLPGAINIDTPLPPLTPEVRAQLKQELCTKLDVPKHYPILVYCKKGIRAAEALECLYGLGYTNVISLGGVDTDPLKSWI